MKTLLVLPTVGLALLPLFSTPPEPTHAPAAPARAYAIDPVHSTVTFKVRHLGVSNFYGRFNQVTGSFLLDRDDAANSSVSVEIATASVDTHDEGRDKHLKSPDFFDVKKHPKITFESTSVAEAEGGFQVTGKLTYRGVEKEITTRAEFIGSGSTFMGDRAGLEARLQVRRSEFGDTKFVKEGALGDEVDLIVSLEGVSQ